MDGFQRQVKMWRFCRPPIKTATAKLIQFILGASIPRFSFLSNVILGNYDGFGLIPIKYLVAHRLLVRLRETLRAPRA